MPNPKIKDVVAFLESYAPRSFQESYDNSGLLTGTPEKEVTGVLVTLDTTEAVVEEAHRLGCNLIVSHHPIIFKGLKKLTGANYVERTVMEAIRRDIALFAIHTNLDNIADGVNRKLAEKIGLTGTRILAPKTDTLQKLVTFIPADNAAAVLTALYQAGAGEIGRYKNCSFQVEGTGTFTPSEGAQPHTGKLGEASSVKEVRVEVLLRKHQSGRILQALRLAHPYEEVAYYLTELANADQEVGAGLVGRLASPEEPLAFLKRLKQIMGLSVIRHTALLSRPIQTVAVCGGAGSFLLPAAMASGADVFVSADFKYHEFFDAEGKITIADVGHFESEQFTKDLLIEVLSKKFPTFAINFSKTVTNPISYL